MKSKQIFFYVTIILFFCVGIYIFFNRINNKIPNLEIKNSDSNISAEFLNAQKAVDYYREKIEKNPDEIKNYIELAQIFLQHARIAGDHHEYIKKASLLIEQAISRQPDNFEAIVSKASIQMTLHQFKRAKGLIEKAIKINQHNASAYGILCDANVELGLYDKAIKACDKMLSIRPDLRSYSRASYLRELHGEKQAAIDAMLLAVNAGVTGQENRAWALYNLGKLFLEEGRIDTAEFIFNGILEERPGYTYAISGLAQVYGAKRDYNKSIDLLMKAYNIVQDHGFLEQIADYYLIIGNKDKEKEFTGKALYEFAEHERDGWNVNHEYAMFCANHNINLQEALARAKQDYNNRPDNIDALDAYAWTLHKTGRSNEAIPYIEKAMRLNTNRKNMLYRAGVIYNSSEKKDLAKKYLKLPLENDSSLNPLYVNNAKSLIASLENLAVIAE